MDFPKNVGDMDRKVRLVIGGGLIIADILNRELGLFTLVGALLVGTAYMRTCLAYVPLNINTAKEGDTKADSKTDSK